MGKRLHVPEGLVASPSSWTGLQVMAGCHPSWEALDQTTGGHYLALNLDSEPLTFERRQTGGWGTVSMDPGTLWLNPPCVSFSHRVAAPCRFVALTVDPAWAERHLGRLPAQSPRVGFEAPRLRARLWALLHPLGGTGGSDEVLFVQTLACEALALLAGVPFAPEPRRSADPRLNRAADRLRASGAEPLGLEDLAEEAGLSPFHFLRSFRRAFGLPPHAFLMEHRLQAARHRVQNPGESLAAVAAELGFADQSHLTRHFRRRFGVAPGTYRNLLQP